MIRVSNDSTNKHGVSSGLRELFRHHTSYSPGESCRAGGNTQGSTYIGRAKANCAEGTVLGGGDHARAVQTMNKRPTVLGFSRFVVY